jgi:histidinol phosphatase-like enzyme (inositol monophosphatase family)
LSHSQEISRRLDLACRIAREAGQLTLDYFEQANYATDRKADSSPVTDADRGAELLLRERIEQAFPGDGILGEEYGLKDGAGDFQWILDPIDGTKSFICGVPFYGTLIGVTCQGSAAAGVVYIPALDDLAFAAKGRGAYRSRRGAAASRIGVSDAPLSESLFVTSQIDGFAARGAMAAFHEIESKAYITRTWGDCYGYLLVATGRAAVMVDPALNLWDGAAIQPILEEAGGAFTDWRGEPTFRAGESIGASRQALEEVLEITRRYPKPT